MNYCILCSSNIWNLCVYFGLPFYLIIFCLGVQLASKPPQRRAANEALKEIHLSNEMIFIVWNVEYDNHCLRFGAVIPTNHKKKQQWNWWLVWFGYFAFKWNNISKERKKRKYCFAHFRLIIITNSLVIRMYHPIHQLKYIYIYVCFGVRNHGNLLSSYK